MMEIRGVIAKGLLSPGLQVYRKQGLHDLSKLAQIYGSEPQGVV